MKLQNSNQPQQPKLNFEDSLYSETSFTQNSYRESDLLQVQYSLRPTIGPDRHSVPSNFYFQNQANQFNEQTPRSSSSMNNSQDNDIFESRSDEEQKMFDQIQKIPKIKSEKPFQMQETAIRVTNFKDLLRLFRVNLSEEYSFELGGNSYILDIDEFKAISPRRNLFMRNSPNDTNNQVDSREISPIPKIKLQNMRSIEEQSPIHNFNTRETRIEGLIGVPSTQPDLIPGMSIQIQKSCMIEREIQTDDQDMTVYFGNKGLSMNIKWEDSKQDQQKLVSTDTYQNFNDEQDDYYRKIQEELAKQIEEEEDIQTSKEVNKEKKNEEKKVKFSINISSPQEKEISLETENSYYKRIQEQLALEIEQEFMSEEEKVDMQNKDKARFQISPKKLQTQDGLQVPEEDDYYAKIQAQLQRELMEEEENDQEKVQQKQEQNKPTNVQFSQPGQSHMKHISHQISPDKLLKPISPFQKKENNNQQTELKSKSLAIDQLPQFQRFMTLDNSQKVQNQQNNNKVIIELNKLNEEKKLLEEKIKQLETIKSSMFIDVNNVADAKLHLAFLFASPLVMRCQGSSKSDNYRAMLQIEFSKEYKEITASIKETEKNLNIKCQQATVVNLTQTFTENPIALHFSGHGIENTQKFLGRDYVLRKDEGNFLVLESDDGEGELVSEKQLSEFIKQTNTKLEFVFVASCNSEPVGRIFKNAGAKHVICVKNGQQIADQAVITFSKSFYRSVFSNSKMTICQCFNMAKKLVEQQFGIGEANKFSILKDDIKGKFNYSALRGMPSINESDEDLDDSKHKCKIFGPLKAGTLNVIENPLRFNLIPSKVDNFVGRQIEMHSIVKSVYQNRLVNLIGLPGIGKTSLAKNAIHYISQRKLFKTGIIFLQLKGYMNCEIFMKKLLVEFVVSNFELDEQEKKEINEGNTDYIYLMSLNFLKSILDNVLIIFDNVEDLLYYDKKAFRILVNDLLVNCSQISILMTSRATLGALQDIQEKIIVLPELNVAYTVNLFISRSREITDQEKKELMECNQGQNNVKDVKEKDTFNNHHLFKLLGGNPHAIILAAPILMKMTLKELYMMLNSKEMHEILQVDGITDSSVASLRVSLEASLMVLEKQDRENNQDGLQFFFLIGMLPGGATSEDLQNIWGVTWQMYVDQLLNSSLLQKKEDEDGNKIRYILPPFMNNYAEAKIKEDDKIKFQNDICSHYERVCKEILTKNGKDYKNSKNVRSSEMHHQTLDKLLDHETNIWACIYRLVDNHAPLISNETEEDEKVSDYDIKGDVQERLQRYSTLMGSSVSLKKNNSEKLEFNFIKNFHPRTKTNEGFKEDDLESEVSGKQFVPAQEIQQKKKNPYPNLQLSRSMRRNTMGSNQNSQAITEDAFSGLIDTLGEPVRESAPNQQQNHRPLTRITLEQINEQNSDNSLHSDESFENYNKVEEQTSQLYTEENFSSDMNLRIKLQEIIRNSVVNFQRQSNPQMQLQKIKSQENQKVLKKKSSLLRSGTQIEVQNFVQSKKKDSKKKKVDPLHSAEKMILYYALNLFLLHENDNAQRLIEQYGLKIKGCLLFEANLRRIFGLILYSKNQPDKSIEQFKDSLNIYKQLKSAYGQGLCHFSLGYIYRSKTSELRIQLKEEQIFNESKEQLENAVKQFQVVNHLIGQAICHKHLAFVYTKLNNRSEIKKQSDLAKNLNKHFSKVKNSPYVSRVHGQEVSLMVEVVHDLENKDLFAKVKSMMQTKKTSSSIFNIAQQPPLGISMAHQSSAPFSEIDQSSPSNNQLQVSLQYKSSDQVEISPEQNEEDQIFSLDLDSADKLTQPKFNQLISQLEVVDEESELILSSDHTLQTQKSVQLDTIPILKSPRVNQIDKQQTLKKEISKSPINKSYGYPGFNKQMSVRSSISGSSISKSDISPGSASRRFEAINFGDFNKQRTMRK